jgi:predicted lysophospholipase L1 biosynthesis ABC-type transport system permease subunit
MHLGQDGVPLTDATVTTTQYLGGYASVDVPVIQVRLQVPADRIDRYAPVDLPEEAKLAIPSLIIEPAAFPGGVDSFPVSRLAILTDGDPATIERVRTAVELALPTSVVRTVGEAATDSASLVIELGRVVTLGVFVAMLLAGASLAIAVISGLVERRTPFALLRLAGLPLARLRAVLVLEAAAPLVAVATLSAVLGMFVTQLLLRALPTREIPLPDLGVAVLLAVATAGAIAVVLAAMPLVGRITGAEANRFE